MRRGEIWVGNLNPNRGAEVGKIRPVLIIQADFLIAQGEPTIIVLPLTTQVRQAKEPLHITIRARDKLLQTCQVVPEQPRTLDRRRLFDGPLTSLRPEEMVAVKLSLPEVLVFDVPGKQRVARPYSPPPFSINRSPPPTPPPASSPTHPPPTAP